jgi:flagellar basal-body rod protein FlgF
MAYDISAISAAMDQKIFQLENVTNNLANAATPGFKAAHLYLLNVLQEESKPDDNTTSLTSLMMDFAQGIFQKTDNPLDVSLKGDGFFVVQTKEGLAYTRKGDFTVNGTNQIVTQGGNLVVGEGGPIVLRNGKIHINEDGSVFVDENQVDKLKIVDFANRQTLRNAGGGLYIDNGEAGIKKVDKPNVISGSIELSNVNVISEMADMINIHRSFEAYQKLIQQLTDQDKLSTSRVGRV